MEHVAVTRASAFVQRDHLAHHDQGLSGYVDIARLLLELNTISRTIAGGPVNDTFFVRERSLYEPLKALLERNLPSTGLVSIENNLHRTLTPKAQTDLSIHAIWHKGMYYKDPDLDCSHFIEIKSVFRGETLFQADIDSDLEKLIACEYAYGATCFFVIVGLSERLEKSRAASSLLARDENLFIHVTSANQTIHLRPAGRRDSCEPFVLAFQVSAHKGKLEGDHRSGAWYSIFQRK
jgi:hypothetical protein